MKSECYLIPLKKYETVLKWYTDFAKKNMHILAIYQIGSIRAPGISDLDLIIVVNNKISRNEVNALSRKNVPSDFYDVLLHDPIVVSEEVMKNIHALLPIYNLKLVYGSSVSLSKIQLKNKKMKLVHLLDCILLYYPRAINNLYLKRNKKPREALCILFLLAFNLKVCQELQGFKRKEYEEFIAQIGSLRSEWFILNNEKYIYLRACIKTANDLCYQLIEDVRSLLKRKKYAIEILSSPKEATFFSKNHSIILKKEWNIYDAQRTADNFFHQTGIVCSILPIEFLYVLKQQCDTINYSPSFHFIIISRLQKEFGIKKIIMKKQIGLYKKYGEPSAMISIAVPLSIISVSLSGRFKSFFKKLLYYLFRVCNCCKA